MSTASEAVINKYIQHIEKILKQDFVQNNVLSTNSEPLSLFHRLICVCILNRTIDEVIITNKGRRNIYVYEQIKCMKERFQHKQRLQLFVEKTLDPLDAVMDQMITVKLEEDMYEHHETSN